MSYKKKYNIKNIAPYRFKLPQFRRMYVRNSILNYQYWFRDKWAWAFLLHIKLFERFKPFKNRVYLNKAFVDFSLIRTSTRRSRWLLWPASLMFYPHRRWEWKVRGRRRWATTFSHGTGQLTVKNIRTPEVYFIKRPLVFNYKINRNRDVFRKNAKHNKIFSVIPKTFRSRYAKKKYYFILNTIRKLTTLRSYKKKLRIYRYLALFLRYNVRRPRAKTLGVVLNYSKNNYFVSLVSKRTGNFIKLFSSGSLKHKTTRRRRDFNSLIECWEKMIKYLKSHRVKRVGFVKVLHKKYMSRIQLSKISQFKQLSRLFKKNKIFVSRWINVVIRAHGLLPRAPKLRRK